MRSARARVRPPTGTQADLHPDPPALRTTPPPPETSAVDADVRGAVGRVLGAILRERAEETRGIDEVFARDVADRVTTFTTDGGKRIRSQLLWWGWRAGTGAPVTPTTDPAPPIGTPRVTVDTVLRLAAALELIQSCALIHDDVMDGSLLRRGRPAVHADFAAHHPDTRARGRGAPFGTSAAVLAGNLALSWADDLVAELACPPAVTDTVRRLWRAMRTEMVAGQYLDLHAQHTGGGSTSGALRIAHLKSALYTVERPLALGAALAGTDPATTDALRSAGRCAGMAFQLRDDLLGVFGDPATTGKPSGDDIREGKLTYLLAIARLRAEAAGDRAASALLRDAPGDPGLSVSAMDRVRAALESTGARAVVENAIERLAADSARHLVDIPLDPAVRHRLEAILRSTTGAGNTDTPTPPDPAPRPIDPDRDSHGVPATSTAALEGHPR
ncbi:polyprenyl synthetase family protein [Streptomyces sp. ST2-7A]|uniref:polyprenyl synthetase family protein n=1 Tax=Streptomyces sp. ST2-7A TaxID=2907214 RepID=UPI001F16FDA5|nr:polyprenyl synthetase family protein [Streptomyces sp. ST2-7A]MCE7079427.1 polyprenyl synthetase family protein [Streptomyces sp. ST2-7A]